jgi:hypothetical protein
MCEIYTLINNKYPNGAFALTRQVYESIVIMSYLIKHRDDVNLIMRFFDDMHISELKTCIQIAKMRGTYEDSCEKKLSEYRKKYSDYCIKNKFSEYWWASKGWNFSELSQHTDFPKDYMYKLTSNIVHMSLLNSIEYIGRNRKDILIGETDEGVNIAGWYSMLCFSMAMDLFAQIYDINFDDLILSGKKLVEKIRTDS